ncbi:hypothetical protein BJY21_002310 [Kineosphaera limosa]|uniref:hypothetical protein n=1 Tax=Kineosphaera limosa TaxID=111564 RepID=UPI0012F9A83A|nr:hypothetical protein [Kineosphaera limosa]NYE01126.1 hypothetical protein [Kineosphaera limosa]
MIVVGSQWILGTFDTHQLPPVTHFSAEVDLMPDVEDFDLMVELSDLIEGAGGELSPFEELHGVALDGVDLTTSVLPLGWRDRLVTPSARSANPNQRVSESSVRRQRIPASRAADR